MKKVIFILIVLCGMLYATTSINAYKPISVYKVISVNSDVKSLSQGLEDNFRAESKLIQIMPYNENGTTTKFIIIFSRY